MTYVTQAYDFFDAIVTHINLNSPKWDGFNITDTEMVTPSQYIVRTTHGSFFCESFEGDDATVYMRVSTFY